MSQYLALLCAGDTSLHIANNWHSNARNFDLCIGYYGNNSDKEKQYRESADYFIPLKGPKWRNIITMLSSDSALDWEKYDYIWLPDDDIRLSVEDANTMFELASTHNIPLCQPALFPDNVSHLTLVHDPNFALPLRPVTFIEIQMPCFSMDAFKSIALPLLQDNHWSISGWGFDVYWSSKIDPKYVLNNVKALHTKPVNTCSSFYQAYNADPCKEMDTFLRKYNLK
jgi:hypothetical protein